MVKKLLFSILITSSVLIKAQDIQLVDSTGAIINNDTLVFTEDLNLDSPKYSFKREDFFKVRNTTNDTMFIDLKRENVLVNDSVGDYFCWGELCLPEKRSDTFPRWIANQIVKTAPNSIAAGALPLSIYIAPHETFGTIIYKYTFFNSTGELGAEASIFVKWIIRNTTSIEENQLKNQFSIYPNPVADKTTISFEKPLNYANQSIEVFNILGERVVQKSLNVGVSKVSLSSDNLVSGVYFVNIMAEGVRVGSKKMIVK